MHRIEAGTGSSRIIVDEIGRFSWERELFSQRFVDLMIDRRVLRMASTTSGRNRLSRLRVDSFFTPSSGYSAKEKRKINNWKEIITGK